MTTITRINQLVFSVLYLAAAEVAFGQIVPTVPPGGRIEQELRSEPQIVRRNVTIDAPRYPEQVPEGADDVKLLLKEVQIQGNSVLTTEKLTPIWADKIGKTISLRDAFQFAAAISARYRQAGYILSQAIVPKQDLTTDGAVVRIEVVEGYIAQVNVGQVKGITEGLQPYANKISAERPLTLGTLERNLLLMNELPGVSVKANLKESTTAGATDMELPVLVDRAAFSVSIHNRTSKALGSVRMEATADFRSTLLNFDRHVFRVLSSLNKRLAYAGYSGEAPAGSSGLKFNWNASGSKAEPKLDIPLNIDSKSTNFGLGLSYPIIRSRSTNLDVRLGVGASNNSSSEPFDTQDKLRTVRAGFTWDLADSLRGVNIIDAEFSKGLSGAGASEENDPQLSRNGLATPDFTKETLYVARLQSLGGPVSLLLAATGQQSQDVLATSEEFGLGGDLFLRAYDPSELVGDYGYAGKVELRWSFGIAAVRSTLYAYQDAGKVYYRTTGTPSQSILSTGIGLRFSMPYGISGYVEAAKPRHKIAVSTGDEDVRVFGGLGMNF